MLKHKPNPKTDVKIGDKVYRCNAHGIVELPRAYKQFNPIEEEEKKIDRKSKKDHKE